MVNLQIAASLSNSSFNNVKLAVPVWLFTEILRVKKLYPAGLSVIQVKLKKIANVYILPW